MKKARLPAIDGIKGIAILAVIGTHIPLLTWYQFVPHGVWWFASIFLSSGGVGVTLFFLISGFLMGFLYPSPQSPLTFYARRYARIFPAFLVMVASFTIFRLIRIPPMTQILVVAGCAFIVRRVWGKFAQVSHRWQSGRGFILAVLVLQAAVAVWYAGFLLRVPPSVFYLDWDPTVRTLVTAAVNVTLTLPFGKYIGQLDGIYWALGAEVFFYLLYPVAILPLIQSVEAAPRAQKLLSGITLFPFCYGLYFVGQRVLGFEMLHLQLIIYFLAGVVIGRNSVAIKRRLSPFQRLVAHPAWLLILLSIIFSSVVIDGYLSSYFQVWLSLLMVVPAGALLVSVVAISGTTAAWLEARLLTGLGKYSYALFLTHSLVIQVIGHYIPADTGIHCLQIAVFSFSGSLLLAFVLHHLTERPYFMARKTSPRETIRTVPLSAKIVRLRLASVLLCVIGVTYFAYRAPLSLFTFVYRHRGASDATITLSDQPFRESLTAQDNNLGMITAHIRKDHIPGVEGGFVPFLLYVRLLDEASQIISQSTYQAYQFLDDRYQPFGFPLETDSKGKRYTIEYQLSEKSPSEEIKLLTDEARQLSVYFIDKKNLLRDPRLLIRWLLNKVNEPFTNPGYWLAMAHLAPFITFLGAIGIKAKQFVRSRPAFT